MSEPSAKKKVKVEKPDKASELWASLGKISVDIELTKARLSQLNQQYQEVYQSLQKLISEKPAKEPSKT